MSNHIRSLHTTDNRVVVLSGHDGWTHRARLDVIRSELAYAAGSPIAFTATGIPRAGNLKLVAGRPDVLVRINGGSVDREHRVSLHIVRPHHEVLLDHLDAGGSAFQVAVAVVGPVKRMRATLAVGCIDYREVADVITQAFATRDIPRVNISLAARREDANGLTLRIPELGIEMPSGLDPLARVLRHGRGTDSSAMLSTMERVAVVSAVLERKHGLKTSVAPNDARTRVDHRVLHAVGLRDAPPHQLLGRMPRCAHEAIHALAACDIIGGTETTDLLSAPDQGLVLVELEHKSRTGVENIRKRIHAANDLGLRVSHCVLVVRDEEEDWFRRRLHRADAIVRALTRVETMSEWYREYCGIRTQFIAEQRQRVRRVAA